jgi:hypothetical protein
MPRVNKDLQRRLAARRERDRRRPSTERRYRFQASAPTDAELEGLEDDAGVDGATDALAPAAAPARSRRDASRLGHTERVGRPFVDYAVEYAYVARDLRRLGFVVGAILLVLLVLYFVLPR